MRIIAKYLTDDFSSNMLSEGYYHLTFKQLTAEQFCAEIKSNDVKNAIKHISTVELVNLICGTNLVPNHTTIDLEFGDLNYDDSEAWKYVFYVVKPNVKLQGGKELTKEEFDRLLSEDKIMLLKIEISDLMREMNEELTKEEECDEGEERTK